MSDIPSWVYDHPDVWVNPGRCGGAPCIRGTRLLVDNILSLMEELTDYEINTDYYRNDLGQYRRIRTAAREHGHKLLPPVTFDSKHEMWIAHEGLMTAPFASLESLKHYYGVET